MLMRRFFLPWLLVTILVFVGKEVGHLFDLFLGAPLFGYDKLLHLLGGVACGIFGAAVVVYGPFDPLRSARSHNTLLMASALVSAMVIGIAWEVLEVIVPSMQDPRGWSFSDTALDLCFDLAGAALAAWWYREKTRPDA
jgi:hydrogenase/urease accessory protein HupE